MGYIYIISLGLWAHPPSIPVSCAWIQAHAEWGRKIFEGAELIIVSPMTRALQTAYFIGGAPGRLVTQGLRNQFDET